jgi:hypothetical protein
MFWEPLEFVFAILLMGFGIISHLWVLGAAGSVGVLFGARYLKRGAKKGAMQHFIWALGLNLDPALSKKFLPAWVNDFTE